ncbi:hypothetical protein NLJ89_g5406 [Agrocybe chaxingu]|uniref:Uncharacterized protein n=2 Tax=Agaricineae TaxID=2982305 RepID=A0A8S0WZI7_CYCAE|nr:hypothetical protein NLJ89_g5406 [Agrocybe chaxingu]CAA7262748.1 unnamed protein product [Cyclocybe aegerita]
MAPWSSKITKRFSTVPPNARENDYYAPYNKLLYTLFPADSDYTVAPQSYSVMNSRDSVDFIIEFEVRLEDKPVFFVEIKEPSKIALKSAREEADNQMRKRMGDLAPVCPLDTLNGVSAFGTRLSFYSYDKRTRILPGRISPDPHMETDTAPLDRWDCDILEDEGAQRFQDLVAEIKRKCDRL